MTFIDMDGVLDNFDLWLAEKLSHITHNPQEAYCVMVKYADECFLNTEPLPHIGFYLEMLRKDPSCYILSALSKPEKLAPFCIDRAPEQICEIHRENKIRWAKKHGIPEHKVIIVPCAIDKLNFCKPGYILYDDRKDIIQKWNELGGIGIHVHNSYWE